MILSSLPSSYSTLVTALETRPEEDLTFSLVESKLIGEYQRRKASGSVISDSNESVMAVSGKDSKLCYFCNGSGHFKIACPGYIAWKEKHGGQVPEQAKLVEQNKQSSWESYEEYLFAVSTISLKVNNKTEWLVDSAATSHATGNANLFSTMIHDTFGDAKAANNAPMNVFGKGTVQIKMVNSKGLVTSTILRDVLFIPGISANILSVKKLTADELKVNFYGDTCEIVRENCQIGVADGHDELYKLRMPDGAMIKDDYEIALGEQKRAD